MTESSTEIYQNALALLGLLIPALLGVYTIVYARKSYMLASTKIKKPVEKYLEIELYYDRFINHPPSKKHNRFLKKAAILSINDGIDIPLDITDVLIEHYAGDYFYLVKRLKLISSNFEVINGNIVCKDSARKIFLEGIGWAVLYIIFGTIFIMLLDGDCFFKFLGGDPGINEYSLYILILTIFFTAALASIAISMSKIYVNEVRDLLIKKFNKEH